MDHQQAVNILRMVLNDNIGNRITEALVLGIEETVVFYINKTEALSSNGKGEA